MTHIVAVPGALLADHSVAGIAAAPFCGALFRRLSGFCLRSHTGVGGEFEGAPGATTVAMLQKGGRTKDGAGVWKRSPRGPSGDLGGRPCLLSVLAGVASAVLAERSPGRSGPAA